MDWSASEARNALIPNKKAGAPWVDDDGLRNLEEPDQLESVQTFSTGLVLVDLGQSSVDRRVVRSASSTESSAPMVTGLSSASSDTLPDDGSPPSATRFTTTMSRSVDHAARRSA